MLGNTSPARGAIGAAMLFGRAFERALGALFRREDPGEVLLSPNGLPVKARTCTIPTETPGIACSGKELCC